MFVIVYILALVAANLLVAWLGPWFSVVNSFVFIGLDLFLRDRLHDQWNGDPRKLGALIVVAGVISYLLNPATGSIAVASVVAFCASMVADAAVYQFLKDKAWLTRVNGSNAAGALVDSVLFPTIAFGSLLPAIVLMQFAAKFSGGAVWAWILRK